MKKKGKLIIITIALLTIVGLVLFVIQPKGITEQTSITNIEIIEEMQVEGAVRRERIDSLNREVDSIRSRAIEIDDTTLDSMLRFLRGLKND